MSRQIFSRNLVHFREAMGVDQYKMAKMLKMEQPAYRAWEMGYAYPKMNTLINLCDFLQYKDLYKLITERINIEEIREHVEGNIKGVHEN